MRAGADADVAHVRGSAAVSPLRAARLRRNWTLDDVVRELDVRDASGSSGATASMVSSWERGLVRTSFRYRRRLCAIYDVAPDVLFAHQDHLDAPAVAAGGVDAHPPRLLEGFPALLTGMISVVESARRFLVVTGSRSQQPLYLEAIESALRRRPQLIHYRVLYGPPRHQVLVDHLVRLIRLRGGPVRQGDETLYVGIVADTDEPERFFVASEHAAVTVVPSPTAVDGFDTGIELGAVAAAGLVEHGRQAYASARRLRTAEDIQALVAKP